jgi:hypothetical protein
MDSMQKRVLTAANKIDRFRDVITKLTLRRPLTPEDRSFALTSAILFIKEYEENRRLTSYAELAYFIILKDYTALYDFSASFGFYPITRKLLLDSLVVKRRITDELVDIQLENFRKDRYIETLHQNDRRTSLMSDQRGELAYIAPTSFGKSSVIEDYIRQHLKAAARVAIIVPTKSLLMQTYRMIKDANLGRRLIIHDEMYQQDETFIGILTQERCLRLMVKANVTFDLLFIDEAHNLFEDDDRSILLSRLIRRNRDANPNQKVVYLSPLVQTSQNLRVTEEQEIQEYTVPFNIKEPDIFEYRASGNQFQYNRFVNEFYELGKYKNKFDYIFKHALQKNFLYCYRPRYVEKLAGELAEQLPEIRQSRALANLVKTLRDEVHEQFFLVDYISKGVIYLHGKMPDLVKEYVESKFSEILDIKYLIANKVILEGMNLPIDNLYIMNTTKLYGREMTNLIGRVNRLNLIFAEGTGAEGLEKLHPPVHFINSEEYNRTNGNMTAKIILLRSRIFNDEIENCTMAAYDLQKIKKAQRDRKELKDRKTLKQEALLTKRPTNENERLYQYLIETGIANFYNDLEGVLPDIRRRISNVQEEPDLLRFIDKVHRVFISGLEDRISNYELLRLQHEETRDFYYTYVTVTQRRALKQNIKYLVTYFQREIRNGNRLKYFGWSYGDLPSPFKPGFAETYLDLSKKSPEELVNLAIIKLKMEDDFVSFMLNKFVIFLHDFDLISTEEFNGLVYGTNDEKKIELTKLGLSISLINRLDEDGMLKFLDIDEFGNLTTKPGFSEHKSEMSDLYRFAVDRFLGTTK